jgi:Fur family ferric uptake transcriptional regulator
MDLSRGLGDVYKRQHLNCEQCGEIIEVPIDVAASFTQTLLDGYGFHTDLTHLSIAGRCESCFNKP